MTKLLIYETRKMNAVFFFTIIKAHVNKLTESPERSTGVTGVL